MTEEKYSGSERYGQQFGEGNLEYLESLLGKGFFEEPMEEQASKMGWVEGCPVKDRVIKNNGAENARNLYTEIIATRRLILEVVRENNPYLYIQMIEDIDRDGNEPIGTHEPTSVPWEHLKTIKMVATPWGYSLPRLLLFQFGEKGKDRSQKNFLKGYELLEKSVEESKNPAELLARFSEKLVNNNPEDIDMILRKTFSKGYLEEQNVSGMYKDLLGEMKKHAPKLFKKYSGLTSEQRFEKRIASV